MLSLLRTAFRILSNPDFLHINMGHILTNSGLFLSAFIIAKILIRDRKFSLKESLFVTVSSLFCGIVYTVSAIAAMRDYPFDIYFYTFLVYRVTHLLSLFFYLHKLKSYPIKKTVILVIFSDLLRLLAHLVPLLIWTLFLPPVLPHIIRFPFLFSTRVAFAILFAFLFVKISGRLRKALNANHRLLTIFFWGSLVFWSGYQVITTTISFESPEVWDSWWPTFLLLGYVVTAIMSFFFYSRSLNTKLLLQRKEIEQENLQFYMSEIEQQQTAMRRFKHDYQNILSSLYSFIEEEDMGGLKQYYASKVDAASAVITRNDFALEALGKIKVREIKGILAVKLLMAQNMGIPTIFEADGEIDHIPMDSVALVRMLGIILDNAIEALTELDKGQLRVACFKSKEGVVFIIQNDCPPDMPKLHQLKQDGFSTKGKSRGQGLNILSELASLCPNVTLDTSIVEGKFVQKLMIGGV